MDGFERAPGDGGGLGSQRVGLLPATEQQPETGSDLRFPVMLGAALTCCDLGVGSPGMLLFSRAAAHPRAVRSALRVSHLEA